jgi:hypothetical protein
MSILVQVHPDCVGTDDPTEFQRNNITYASHGDGHLTDNAVYEEKRAQKARETQQ